MILDWILRGFDALDDAGQVVPRSLFESGLMLEGKVTAFSGNESACHVGGFQAEGATACHRVDKRNPRKTFCVILSGVRSTKSKDLKSFKKHSSGDGLFEGGVVDKTLVAPLVELFSGQVQGDCASVVDESDEYVLRRGVRGGAPRRGGSGCG